MLLHLICPVLAGLWFENILFAQKIQPVLNNEHLYKALITTTKEKKLAVMKRIAAAGAKKSGVRKIKNHRLRHLRLLVPCSSQTPPCLAFFLHPSCLQSFTLAPCLTQTALYDFIAAPVLPAEYAFAFPRTPLLVMPHA